MLLTIGLPFIFRFPPPYSFNMEEARVRQSTDPRPQGAHRLWENSDYAWVNHQAEKGRTAVVQARCLLKGGRTEKCNRGEATCERREYWGCGSKRSHRLLLQSPCSILDTAGEQAASVRDQADTDTSSPARTRQFWKHLRPCSLAPIISLAQINSENFL